MRLFSITLIILSIGLIASNTIKTNSQVRLSNDVAIPREIAIPLIAYQPGSPLKPEFIQLRKPTEGGSGSPLFRFRNQSGKSIRSYLIADLYPGGVGGEWGSQDNHISPGELIPEEDMPTINETDLLNDDQRKSLGLQGPMQAICIFLVVRVEFSDGSVFDDRKAYESLKKYLEKIQP
jgi:hypothetical protein